MLCVPSLHGTGSGIGGVPLDILGSFTLPPSCVVSLESRSRLSILPRLGTESGALLFLPCAFSHTALLSLSSSRRSVGAYGAYHAEEMAHSASV